MTQAMTLAGRSIFYPPSLAVDDRGLIRTLPHAELKPLAESIAPEGLMTFASRLIRNARKRRHKERWQAVNRQRLELAQLCLERALFLAPAAADVAEKAVRA